MHIGMMNDPAKNLSDEITFAGESGFDFIDITIEPSRAQLQNIKLPKIRDLLQKHQLAVVGHTNVFLLWASAVERVRRACLEELKGHIAFFSELGAKKVNIHSHWFQPNCPIEEVLERNIQGLHELSACCQENKVTLMLENQPNGPFNTPETLAPFFNMLPELKFHLDIGHAHVAGQGKSTVPEFLTRFADRLAHVHLSDNHGLGDEHLALGQGSVDWQSALTELQQVGYSDTLTLEIFKSPRPELLESLQQVRQYLH